ncbi:MAG: hypothetical protein HYW25_00730 [Candidatus Aenigmarchaeota archaeon]|nr:hypothetical protein [Candidatus Aenigmarchaeota archaeon]
MAVVSPVKLSCVRFRRFARHGVPPSGTDVIEVPEFLFSGGEQHPNVYAEKVNSFMLGRYDDRMKFVPDEEGTKAMREKCVENSPELVGFRVSRHADDLQLLRKTVTGGNFHYDRWNGKRIGKRRGSYALGRAVARSYAGFTPDEFSALVGDEIIPYTVEERSPARSFAYLSADRTELFLISDLNRIRRS